jgi:hypothetical protein
MFTHSLRVTENGGIAVQPSGGPSLQSKIMESIFPGKRLMSKVIGHADL